MINFSGVFGTYKTIKHYKSNANLEIICESELYSDFWISSNATTKSFSK